MKGHRPLAVPLLLASLVVGGCGGSSPAGSGCGNAAELNAAKAAFTGRGVKFTVTIGPDRWRKLQPALRTVGSDVPVGLRPHTVGYAISFPFSRLRVVYVLDSSSSAARFAAVLTRKSVPAGDRVLVARDVVYFGLDDRLAHRAMASLRH